MHEHTPQCMGRSKLALVSATSIELLAEALAGEGFMAYAVDDDGVACFTCPRCEHHDHNLGTARIVTDASWRCTRCRSTGTRWQLERMVLENLDAIGRLADLLGAGV